MSKLFRKFFSKVRVYLKVTKASGIARRYFVMNGFDGAMTVFGIVLGSWIAGVSKPEIIILAGLGACLAMGFSGFFGAYMAEKAERERRLKEMEKATHNNVNPIQYEAARFVTVYVALIDGLSPALTAIISIMPFIFVSLRWVTIFNAYIASLALSLATLFLLGIYLGKVARENGWLYGVAMLTVGAFTALIIFLIQLIASA
ncbi:MAG: VIT1/CCC1 transporter family protein [Candidatus Bathyarchaeia archaeon]|nr:VIT1/CCC1 transporter family protein [Candidatus Bathyarchaeia archaeon]MDI6905581.1 VIT1/CCC1 transporter family protein [Candidatus Bathyarchaeia archaeon]